MAKRIFNKMNAVVMLAFAICTLYPMLYILFASLSEPVKFIGHTGLLFGPLGLKLEAYRKAFSHPLMITSYLNTLFIVGVGTAISLVLTSLGAYFLSRKNVMLQKHVSFFIILTMFFSGGLIPFYFTVKNLSFSMPFFHLADGVLNIVFKQVGLFNTLWALILPSCINTFNLMVMRTGFLGVPDELSEAAFIDGCGHMGILFKIMIPLIMPTVAVMVLYYGVAYWNAWFNASLFINEPAKYPLQLVLRQIIINSDTNNLSIGADAGEQMAIGETIKYATIVIATLPVLVLYPLLQRYFVSGVMIGAVKG